MSIFEADYESECVVCGNTPCVVAINDGEEPYHFDMCGVCTFGEAECLDPDVWVTEAKQ